MTVNKVVDQDFSYSMDSYFSFMVSLSEIKVHQKRSVYNMLDFFGDLGGIFGSVYFISGLLNYLVTGKD